MQVNSLGFIFFFLPLSILFYYLIPTKHKNKGLLFLSLLFYSLMDVSALLLMVACVGVDFLLSRQMQENDDDQRIRKRMMLLSVGKTMGLLLIANILFQTGYANYPFGLSVYSLTAMGYMLDVFRGDAPYEENFWDFMLFCVFFGKLYAGPLVEYTPFRRELKKRRSSLSAISDGVLLFSYGVAKQVILVYSLNHAFESIRALGELTVVSGWLYAFTGAMMVYYTLSGYSDIARGLGLIYSMRLPPNMNYPFQADSISDFLARFNTTIHIYIQKYIYYGLGGEENGSVPMILNTMLTTMLMGIWFGLRLNFLLWGAYLGVLLLLENKVFKNLIRKVPPFLQKAITFLLVLFSFPLFVGGSLQEGFRYLGAMFGIQTIGLLNDSILYVLESHLVLYLLCILFCTCYVRKLTSLAKKSFPKTTDIVGAGTSILLLLLTTGFIMTRI